MLRALLFAAVRRTAADAGRNRQTARSNRARCEMTNAVTKGFLAACLGAVALVATGCPAPEACGGPCPGDQACDTATNECKDLCAGKTCEAGLGCNAADGK